MDLVCYSTDKCNPGKRNTSLAFFTNYERDQLKDRWGSQKARLSRESFLPLAGCHLCLQSAREPVACRDGGHIFCRECAVTNLLAQRKEIQRLVKEDERRKDDDAEAEKEKAGEKQEGVVQDFERTMMGLESTISRDTTKRKHEQIATEGDQEERNAMSRKGDLEKVSIQSLVIVRSLPFPPQNFWMPASVEMENSINSSKHRKLHPVCPSASSKDSHPFSLKTLIAINFTTSSTSPGKSDTATVKTESKNGESATILCPACKKGLSASSKATMTVPCGHVLCKACVDKFMRPKVLQSAGKHSVPLQEDLSLICYVCQTDLTEQAKGKQKDGKKSKDKDKIQPGLVELSSQGTGFASGGKAVIDKAGIAFQC